MTDPRPLPQSCEESEGSLTEMALGSLSGRDRSIVLAHLEHCSRCTVLLEELAGVADALVQVAPEREPPVGFEVRLFDRVHEEDRREEQRKPEPPRRSGPRKAVLAVAAAVVAVAVGFGAGWLAQPGGQGSAPSTAGSSGALLSAHLVTPHGEQAGQVMIYEGSPSWAFMSVHDVSSSGWVDCQVVTTGGTTLNVGTFWLHGGYGAWGSSLPVRATDVRTARLVMPRGTVLASAQLPT